MPTLSQPVRRFARNRAALASALVLAGGALAVLLLLPYALVWYDLQALDTAARQPPSLGSRVPYARAAPLLDALPAARSLGRFGATVHATGGWLGYDALGRSLLFRLVLGWAISLFIGAGAATLASAIGVLWGASAALAGGRIDAVMMRTVDILYGLPYILLVILLRVSLEEPLTTTLGGRVSIANILILFVAIGAVGWLTMARLVRGQVLSLRARTFLEAARASGAGRVRILLRHVLPNVAGPALAYAALMIPQAILQESFLSFLGIGVQAPLPSLGRLAAEGVDAVNPYVSYGWTLVFPCAALAITLAVLNFLGDGLRDALDPRPVAQQID